jgi:hypothetical protein
VEVNVTAGSDGSNPQASYTVLSETGTPASAIAFTNTYSPGTETATISGVKTAENWPAGLPDPSFAFRLEQVGGLDGSPYTGTTPAALQVVRGTGAPQFDFSFEVNGLTEGQYFYQI